MKKLVLAIATVSLVACGSTGVLPVGNATARPKPEGCDIAVFESAEDVGRPFEKLCLIDANTGSTLYNNRGVSGAMKKVNRAACECGADAVIVQGMEKKGVSLMSWGSAKASVVAIRYTRPTPVTDAGPVGKVLVTPTGETFGKVVSVVPERRFQDNTIGEGFLVEVPGGAKKWLKGEQARTMLPGPAPKEKE